MANNRGRSSLGLCHPKYDVLGFTRSFKDSHLIRFGWLDHFFNPKNSKHAVKVMKSPKEKVCRVHIINGPGLNNNRVQPHEITRGYTQASLVRAIERREPRFMERFRTRLRAVDQVVQNAPAGSLTLYVSPWLEHGPVTRAAFDILAAEIRGVFGDIGIVDNPREGGFISGYLKEKHGAAPGRGLDIVDMDGTDIETLDVPRWYRGYEDCIAVYGWGLSENGNHHKDTTWKPPSQRTNWPTQRENQIYRYLVDDDSMIVTSELDSRDTEGALHIHESKDGKKKGFLFKLGDDKNYAIALFPARFTNQFEHVRIMKGGEVIDTGRYRGKYTHDGSNRLIYDFKKHPTKYSDNSVIRADDHAWVLQKPQFRID